jgi:hypothetical protein
VTRNDVKAVMRPAARAPEPVCGPVWALMGD